jgi:hypothetical protein
MSADSEPPRLQESGSELAKIGAEMVDLGSRKDSLRSMFSVPSARPNNRPTNPRSPALAHQVAGVAPAQPASASPFCSSDTPPPEALSHTRSPAVSRAGPVIVQGDRSAATMPGCQKKLACVLASSSKSYPLSIPDLEFGGRGWEDSLES